MTWQTVGTEPSELGESPFWHPSEQMLYWVDINGKKINRCSVLMGTVESWAMPSEPGCIAPAHSRDGTGGLVIALRDGIYRAADWGGELKRIHQPTHDTATTRFNDGKADPLGRLWAGTMFEPRTSPEAALYSFDCRAGDMPRVQQHVIGATIANGLAWSPDATTIYWADTPTHTVRAWDWDAQANVMTNERVFKRWPDKSELPAGWRPGMTGYQGRPDGAAVDIEGNYYIAMFEGGRIFKLSPQGDVLQDIALPALCPTMPCLGGGDLKTLYVTTARHHRSADELARYPQSGCVFSMRVDVPGLPVNVFKG